MKNCTGVRYILQGATDIPTSPPRTKADRIRAMTDEELAAWASSVETDGRAFGPKGKAAWLDLLRQEAD